MFLSVSFFLSFFSILDQQSILDEASRNGFYYRFVDISAVDKCQEKEFCVVYAKNRYLIRKKDGFIVSDSSDKDKITVEITPEDTYISYFLFVQHKAGVYKIQMNKKKVVIDSGIQNIQKIQIVGTSFGGPRVIWEKTYKDFHGTPFSVSFDESFRKLRKHYSLKPVELSTELQPAAEDVLKRLKNEGLIHYSPKSGSIRHTGIIKKIIGENLFIAESIEKAWNMNISSPSHLYNLISPQFKKYFITFIKENDILYGVIVFSE